MKPIIAEIIDRIISRMSKSQAVAGWIFSFILLNVKVILRLTSLLYPSFRHHLGEKNFTAQIRTKDNRVGRYFTFRDGRLISKRGIHPRPDMTISYYDAALGARLMTPWRSQLEQVSAMKNFKLWIEGPDELTSWFLETLSMMLTEGLEYGPDVDGRTGVRPRCR